MKKYTPRKTLSATQQQIVCCTMETIAEIGFAQATIGEVAQRLGISKGVVQYHFASKEELVQEVIAHIYATARSYMTAQIWGTSDEWQQIRSFIVISCKFYQQHLTSIKALQSIQANFRPTKHASLAQTFYGQELADLANVFISGQEKGLFRAFDPDIAALTLRLALNGAVIALTTKPDYDVQKHADELVELFAPAFLQNSAIVEM